MEILTLANGTSLGWCTLHEETGHTAGRRLLAALYRDQTGCDLPPIAVTELGKPYFEGDSLHFSISHTSKHAFCALSPTPIGIDAEETDRPIRLALADKILSPTEREAYNRASDKRAALLRLWVLKEAAAKYRGQGLRGYPNHTHFSPDDSRIREIAGCYVAIITEGE